MHTNYLMDQLIPLLIALLNASDKIQKGSHLYNAVYKNLTTPNGPAQIDLIQKLHNATQGRYLQGINQPQLVNDFLRPWLRELIASCDIKLRQYQQQMGGTMQSNNFVNPAFINATGSVFGGETVVQPQQQVIAAPAPAEQQTNNASQYAIDMMSLTPDQLYAQLDVGHDITLNIRPYSTMQFGSESSIVKIVRCQIVTHGDHYQAYNCDIQLETGANSPEDVAHLVYDALPQEMVRHPFVHLVRYNQLVHVDVDYTQFKQLIKEIVANKENGDRKTWRDVMESLNLRTRFEWDLLNRILIRFFNERIPKTLFTSNRVGLTSIDTIDDLKELDDRHSKLAVTKHEKYWRTFQAMVSSIFSLVFTPEHLIGPDDKQFGDFIKCDGFEYNEECYTKYDYGAFSDAQEREAFIKRMMSHHIVLRIPRKVLITNLVDERIVASLSLRSTPIFLNRMRNLGIATINAISEKLFLDVEERNIDDVICIGQDSSIGESLSRINLARSLDGDFVFKP